MAGESISSILPETTPATEAQNEFAQILDLLKADHRYELAAELANILPRDPKHSYTAKEVLDGFSEYVEIYGNTPRYQETIAKIQFAIDEQAANAQRCAELIERLKAEDNATQLARLRMHLEEEIRFLIAEEKIIEESEKLNIHKQALLMRVYRLLNEPHFPRTTQMLKLTPAEADGLQKELAQDPGIADLADQMINMYSQVKYTRFHRIDEIREKVELYKGFLLQIQTVD